jgi:TonB family protein
VIALLWTPRSTPTPLPGVVTVDLVGLAAPVAAAKPAARAAAPAPRDVEPVPPAPRPVEAQPAPAPEVPKPQPPKPEPPKPVPAPPPRAETVLPKKPEREPEKPKATPEPKPEPKPEPRQVAKATPPKPAPPKQEGYDDLLAELRAEHGETKPERVERPVRAASASGPAAAPSGRSGAPVDPAFAGWARAVQIHLSRAWILPPEMKSRRLMTELLVDLDAQGNVLSEPRIVRGSGDARFDENAVRAVKKASPLPPPPEIGVQSIQFCPECG